MKRRGFLRWFLGLWTVWLLWMLLLGRLSSAFSMPLSAYAADHLGVVPLRVISKQILLSMNGDRHAIANLGGNLLLFLPYGLFLPALFRPLRNYLPFLTIFAGSILLVELGQLLLRVGFCEVDDLLLNCLGASLGFLIWKLRFRKEKGTCFCTV